MRRLTARERTWAAVLLLAVAAAAGWLLIVRPVLRGFADRAERRRELAFEYLRDERAIGQLPSLGRAAVDQRRAAARFRLVATDQAGAAAALRDRLARAITAAGAQAGEAEELAPSPGVVRLRVRVGLTVRQLAALLGQLNNGLPPVAVDAMRIDAKEDTQPNGSGLLDTTLDVSATYSASQPR